MASNYNLIYKLIADDKQFKTGFDRATTVLERHTSAVKKNGNSYNKMQVSLRKLNDVARNAFLKFGEGSKEFKEATAAAKAYQIQLKKVDMAMQKAGLTSKQMAKKGGLGSSIIGVATNRIVPLLAISTLTRGMTQAGKVFKDFEATLSEVEGISGATAKELSLLSMQAKDLGRTTQRTATDVLRLQVELSKLGFTARQIEQATEAVLALSVATRTDLGEAAQVVASTLKAFHLEASEAQRVADVMSKAFVSSALNMEKFRTGMAILAPAAYTAGLSIEGATAALGVLADNGLDASMAGTSLRNIFLELSMKGLNLDDVLNEIATSSNKAGAAQQYFEKRSASAAIILSQNQSALIELTAKTYLAEESTAKLAKTMADNLAGDIELARSAWQGFILSIEDGDGAINKMVRGSLKGFAMALDLINFKLSTTEMNAKRAAKELDFSQAQKNISSNVVGQIGSFADEYKMLVEKAKREEWGYSKFVKESTRLRANYRDKEREALIKQYEDALYWAKKDQLNQEKLAYEDGTIDKDEKYGIAKRLEYIRLLNAELAKLREEGLMSFTPDDAIGGDGDNGEEIVGFINKMNAAIAIYTTNLNEIEANNPFDEEARAEVEKYKALIESAQQAIENFKNGLPIALPLFVDDEIDQAQLDADIEAFVGKIEPIVSDKMSQLNVGGLVAGAISDTAAGLGEAISLSLQGADTDPWGNYFKQLLSNLGGYLMQLGGMMIAFGTAQLAFNSGEPLTMIIAGAALVALGAGITAAFGGASITGNQAAQQSAPSITVKPCKGYSQYSQGYSGGSNGGTSSTRRGGEGEVQFVIKGNDLVGVLDKTERRNANFR